MFSGECDSSMNYPIGGMVEPYDMARDSEELDDLDFFDLELRTAAEEIATMDRRHKDDLSSCTPKPLSTQRKWLMRYSWKRSLVRELTKDDVNMMAMQGAIQS